MYTTGSESPELFKFCGTQDAYQHSSFRMKVLVSREDLLSELAEKLDKRRFDGSRIIVGLVQCNLFMGKWIPD